MTPSTKKILEFGPFRLDGVERVLLRDGQPVPLTLKAFDVLLLLVENNGHIVEKDELMNRVWAGSFVEEGNLKVTVSMLRKALGDNQNSSRYIETVPRRGYRFVASVRDIAETVDVVVHERTRERVTIDELTTVPDASRRGRSPYLIAGLLLIVLGIVFGSVLLRSRNEASFRSASKLPIKSIAVLPFKPLVASNRDEALELGIADTLIMRLSSLDALQIPPTNSIRKYNRFDQDPVTAGRELRVDSVLDGSLHREGDRLRVTVRLVRVSDGETLWAEQFDENMSQIFSVEDRVSERLMGALAVKLTGEQREMLVKHYTKSSEAYELYLKGNYSSQIEAELNKSLEYYERATKLDSGYALAYAELADVYIGLSRQHFLRPAESFPKAAAATTRALELDERLVEAHTTLGIYKFFYEWNSAEAERQFKRAIELDPNNSRAHSEYGSYLANIGRFDEAINERKRAHDLDPTSAVEFSNLAFTYDLAGKYDESLAHFEQAIKLNPLSPWPHFGISRVYYHLGNFEEAIAENNYAMTLSDGSLNTICVLGYLYAVTGKRNEARKVIADLEERAKKKYVPPYLIAIVYAGLGDREQTFIWLDRAYEERHWGMTHLANDPVFDRVRPDPRFANLMRRVGLTSFFHLRG